MSLFLSLLGWTKLPPWVIELAVVVLVAGGVWLYQEHVSSKLIDAGRSAQRLEDQKALDKLRKDTATQQQLIQASADKAHQQYEREHADLTAYQLAHPILSAVQLCQQPAPRRGSGDMHATSGVHAGTDGNATTGKVFQPVYPSDSPGADYRLRLLDGFGRLCDTLSSSIRESQHR